MSEAYLEPSEKSMVECFYKNSQQLTIFVKKNDHKCLIGF